MLVCNDLWILGICLRLVNSKLYISIDDFVIDYFIDLIMMKWNIKLFRL